MERFSSAPFPTTEIMSMTMREQRYAFSYQILNAGNIACIAGAKGRIQTGTWQGIWLGEHRIQADRVALSRHYKGSKK